MELSFIGYFVEGIKHITDLGGIDHMVFLLALIAGFEIRHLGKVILLATAFTIGHSISLALAASGYFAYSSKWIEFLIPISILITALISAKRQNPKTGIGFWRYFVTMAFGLIHGLGFTSYFRMILPEGESIVSPLLAFNLGIEAGQVIILLAMLLVFFLAETFFRVKTDKRSLFVSGLAAGMSVLFMLEKWPF